ncbi:MAG: insulinase family protein [Pseudopedobacter saltans]|uniref:Insulinase family protein n=1 Tax=Pseudopedobacter saltans TaxID=151895 RepID=A0A2W5EFH7_9SPHI|nr:MAG: insulinase family protein [Pseudopedobacter saltans]
MKPYCFLLCLFCFVYPFDVSAQYKLAGNMFFKKLSNGLDVLAIEDNTVPLATIMVTIKNGAYTEPPRFNGLSHLYEHMFFKSNKDYPTLDEFQYQESKLGINSNATTSYEKVNYFFTLPKKNLKPGLNFMNSALRFPKFDKNEMEREKIVVNAEFQRKESNPYYALADAMNRHMWGDLYSRRNTIGNHNVILSATPDLMDSIKNKYYYPNNSLLTIAGDIDHNEVFNLVEKIFGSWAHSPFDPFELWPIPTFEPLEKNDYFIVESQIAKVPIIEFCWQGPEMHDDITSTYAADVFSYAVEQNSSKLNKALVQSGLALDVSVSYLTLNHKGPITILIVPNANKLKECIEEAKRQISLFKSDDYLTDDQIENAKRALDVNKIIQRESALNYSEELSFWWASTSLDYFSTYLENVNKISRQDIQNYIQRYIIGKPYCAGLIINPSQKSLLQPETFFQAN